MIYVYKSKRLLEYAKHGKTVFTCPVMLGSHPTGHKTQEGDGRTPEGKYRICSINRSSKFHISLGINFPNSTDAVLGFKNKRIDIFRAGLIIAADFLHLRPLWHTSLGGFIMLHGESPDGKTGDWTQGCIAVKNADIEKLASACSRGETVIIEA